MPLKPNNKFLTILFFLIPSLGFCNWSSTHLQLLYGNNYKLGLKQREALWFNHVSGHSFGDNYFWFKVTSPTEDTTSVIGEYHPRFSLNKIFNKDFSIGPIKEIFQANALEFGNGSRAYLFGIGFNLNVPGFKYLKTNFYWRDKQKVEGRSFQWSTFWMSHLNIKSWLFVFTGFFDLQTTEGTRRANFQIAPQFLVDLGNFWASPNKYQLGLKPIYWKNKFGQKGVNEFVPQAIFKWYF